MIKFRRGIFETNSSSTHEITIANNDYDDFKKNLPETLYFECDEYGWEHRRYQTVQDRANYLYTGVVYLYHEDYIKFIKDTLEEWGVHAEFQTYEQYNNGILTTKYGCSGFCYIDHGYDLEEFINKVCNDEILLMNYLFSDESFVATGNDNDREPLDSHTSAKNILLNYYKGN